MRWESIYRLTPKTPIDIVVLGNSHVNTGVEPFSLSCALNCTAFDMAPSGIMIADAYYCLKELLTRTTPKLVVVETYLMRGIENNKLRGAALADEFRSFYPRRNLKIKLGTCMRRGISLRITACIWADIHASKQESTTVS